MVDPRCVLLIISKSCEELGIGFFSFGVEHMCLVDVHFGFENLGLACTVEWVLKVLLKENSAEMRQRMKDGEVGSRLIETT